MARAVRRGGPAALRGVGRPRKTALAWGPPPARRHDADALATARGRIAELERKVGEQPAGAQFFQASLTPSRGVMPAERRAWRDGVDASSRR